MLGIRFLDIRNTFLMMNETNRQWLLFHLTVLVLIVVIMTTSCFLSMRHFIFFFSCFCLEVRIRGSLRASAQIRNSQLYGQVSCCVDVSLFIPYSVGCGRRDPRYVLV